MSLERSVSVLMYADNLFQDAIPTTVKDNNNNLPIKTIY